MRNWNEGIGINVIASSIITCRVIVRHSGDIAACVGDIGRVEGIISAIVSSRTVVDGTVGILNSRDFLLGRWEVIEKLKGTGRWTKRECPVGV